MLTVPAIGNFNQVAVQPDCILKNPDRMGRLFETFTYCLLALQDASRSQTSLNVAVPNSSFDVDAGATSQSMSLPYYIDDTTGNKKATASLYIQNAAGWTIPAAGDLAGCESVFDAYLIQARYMLRINDAIQPMASLIGSAAGIVTIEDSETESVLTTTLAAPFNQIIDKVTGKLIDNIFNVPVILDLQYSNPLVV